MPVSTVVLILGLALIAYAALRAVLAYQTARDERRAELLETAALAGPEAARIVLAGLQRGTDRDLGFAVMRLQLALAEIKCDQLQLELRMADQRKNIGKLRQSVMRGLP